MNGRRYGIGKGVAALILNYFALIVMLAAYWFLCASGILTIIKAENSISVSMLCISIGLTAAAIAMTVVGVLNTIKITKAFVSFPQMGLARPIAAFVMCMVSLMFVLASLIFLVFDGIAGAYAVISAIFGIAV